MLPVIAQDAGMTVEDTAATIDTFVFPTVEDQLNAKWLGGGAQTFMGGVANVFVEARYATSGFVLDRGEIVRWQA